LDAGAATQQAMETACRRKSVLLKDDEIAWRI
jgi:hypothetical protein